METEETNAVEKRVGTVKCLESENESLFSLLHDTEHLFRTHYVE
jgi:hypothetical protein